MIFFHCFDKMYLHVGNQRKVMKQKISRGQCMHFTFESLPLQYLPTFTGIPQYKLTAQ